MTASTEIPYPPLTRRYVELKDWASQERLRQANEITAAVLVEEFLGSVEAFSHFNTEGLTDDDEFFPTSRTDEGKNPDSDAHTYGWAMVMKGMGTVRVDGGDDLAFRYVEREIIPTRTKPQLRFSSADGKHVRVDLVLANATTSRPIVGELKIAADKDPLHRPGSSARRRRPARVSRPTRAPVEAGTAAGVDRGRAANRRLRTAGQLPHVGP